MPSADRVVCLADELLVTGGPCRPRWQESINESMNDAVSGRSDRGLEYLIVKTLCGPNSISQLSKSSLCELYVLLPGSFDGAEEQTLEFNGEGGIGNMDVTIVILRNSDLHLMMHPLIVQHPFPNDDFWAFVVDGDGKHNLHLAPAISPPKANVRLKFGLRLGDGDFQCNCGPATIMSMRCSKWTPCVVNLFASHFTQDSD